MNSAHADIDIDELEFFAKSNDDVFDMIRLIRSNQQSNLRRNESLVVSISPRVFHRTTGTTKSQN